MTSSQRKAVRSYRRRQKKSGMVRVEVQVSQGDAALVRSVANALNDPGREWDARVLLQERFAAEAAKGLKALLAAAPLEDVDLSRDPDVGRDIEW